MVHVEGQASSRPSPDSKDEVEDEADAETGSSHSQAEISAGGVSAGTTRAHGGDQQVDGVGQRVKVEAARSIEVNGLSQDVSWVRGVDGPEPRVESNGLGNSVHRVSAEQFKAN